MNNTQFTQSDNKYKVFTSKTIENRKIYSEIITVPAKGAEDAKSKFLATYAKAILLTDDLEVKVSKVFN